MKNVIILLLALMQPALLMAQPAGNIRGIVTDGASGQPLPYVTVAIINSDLVTGTTTDSQGQFRLSNLPVGRYDIESRFVGYETAMFREIMVTSGREAFIEITMLQNIYEVEEVVVRPRVNKEIPLNPMAVAGGRMLSVEEASRYAGGLDDPARLVTAFAGVSGSLGSNGISIRGNSPMFLQWRLEGSEAVNPTHFSDITGVGGGVIAAMSSHVLGNSDFFTGAFPAEYGNALSGVFDMQLRTGNNQNHEHTAQIGTLGVEFASEGPIGNVETRRATSLPSYLINYRYSSMALLGDLFPDMLEGASGMRYQDLSFKINLPTKQAGTFTVWGIWIKDHFIAHVPNDTLKWDDFNGLGSGGSDVELLGTNADFWQT